MKRLVLVLGLLTASGFAQFSLPPIQVSAADPAVCTTSGGIGELKIYYNTVSHTFKFCSSANTWSAFSGNPFTSGGTTANVIPKSNGSSLLQDSPLMSPDANTVQQANTTTAQTFYIYNTTDSNSSPTNYERLALTFVSNAVRIAAQKGGTGTSRAIGLQVGTGQVLSVLDGGGSNRFQIAGDTGTVNFYNATTAVGQGLVPILGVTSQRAETTTADANVLTVTPPATVATYRVSVNISVSSATSGVIAWTLSWTDSNGNAQSNIAMPLFQLATASPNTTFTTSAAGNYTGTSTIDVNNAAAAIVVKWVGGGTTTAKMSAFIERIQ